MNADFLATCTTRIVAFAAAVLTSTVVLGATALGMQPAAQDGASTAIALERVVVTAPAIH